MSDTWGAPAVKARAVDISVADHDVYCRALYVGGAGNVVVILWDPDAITDETGSVTISNVAAGTTLSMMVRRVVRTNTTATLMVALY